MNSTSTAAIGRRSVKRWITSASFVLTTFLGAQSFTFDILVENGDPSPDGNGAIGGGGDYPPSLNDAGRALIHVRAGLALERMVCAYGGGSPAEAISREGSAAPDGNGSLFFYDRGTINSSGRAVFHAALVGSAGTWASQGVFRSGPTLEQVARGDDIPPDGNGVIADFAMMSSERPVLLNDAGESVFNCRLDGTVNPGLDDEAIYLHNGVALTLVARRGGVMPDGLIAREFDRPTLNNSAQVAFPCFMTNFESQLVRSGAGGLEKIVGSGSILPGGRTIVSAPFAAVFNSIVPINASGKVVFTAQLDGTGGVNEALCVGDTGGLVTIVEQTDPAPGGGVFYGLPAGDSAPALNDQGAVAFVASVDLGGFNFRQGIFTGDGSGPAVEIAREGQAPPEGNGTFEEFSLPVINNCGDVVFTANIAPPGGGDVEVGLYRFAASTGVLDKVVRPGDTLDGSIVVDVDFGSTPGFGNAGSGLNNAGQIAFEFGTQDGRGGVAVANPPGTMVVTILSASGGPGGLTLTWSISGGGGVDIYRSTDLSIWGLPIATNVLGGTYTDNSAPPGGAYYALVPTGQSFP